MVEPHHIWWGFAVFWLIVWWWYPLKAQLKRFTRQYAHPRSKFMNVIEQAELSGAAEIEIEHESRSPSCYLCDLLRYESTEPGFRNSLQSKQVFRDWNHRGSYINGKHKLNHMTHDTNFKVKFVGGSGQYINPRKHIEKGNDGTVDELQQPAARAQIKS